MLEGGGADEIVREARDWGADLVVVGARGLGLVDVWLLGSVSLAVARRVDAAVLVIKGSAHRLEHVVVGLDGSELTKALDQVAPLFEAHGVTVSREMPDGLRASPR